MRAIKLLLVVFLIAGLSACTCRSKKVGPGDGNVPVAEAGSVLRDVNFAFDSSNLDASARDILASNAQWLKANSNTSVQIEGHCDERGTNEYNMALGWRRARSAESYLRSLGISSDRMSTVSYGEELPLDPRHNEVAWAKNRRAHFKVQ